MTDRPILFSAPMVRALLSGTKTQTRRVFNLPKWAVPGTLEIDDDGPYACAEISGCLAKVPTRINSGDRLYVREHWRTAKAYDDLSPSEMGGEEPVRYLADNVLQTWGFPTAHFEAGRHRQAMHMPRWASRLTLTVTDVRVERLQDISEADAIAEGVERAPKNDGWWKSQTSGKLCPTARDAYGDLWNHINGPGAWEANPWVVAYTFTVHRGNIDQIGGAA